MALPPISKPKGQGKPSPEVQPREPRRRTAMNKEDIIRMAREAHGPLTGTWWDMDIASLERFAALVASAEREACADIAENWNSNGFPRTGVAEQIRARGQA